MHDAKKWLHVKLQWRRLVHLSKTQDSWQFCLQLRLSRCQRPVLERKAFEQPICLWWRKGFFYSYFVWRYNLSIQKAKAVPEPHHNSSAHLFAGFLINCERMNSCFQRLHSSLRYAAQFVICKAYKAVPWKACKSRVVAMKSICRLM